VHTKNFKTSPVEEDDVEMTGDGEDSGESSRDEDDFEKQIRLVNDYKDTCFSSEVTPASVRTSIDDHSEPRDPIHKKLLSIINKNPN